jgi:uncharacterized protein YndB with AHSA1/START domain
MTLLLTRAPIAKTEMLIRRPAADVFEAFVDPSITSKFWFSKGSGRLEVGKKTRWDWEMYGFSIEVDTRALEANRRILIAWPSDGAPTTVEWAFKARPDGTTFVTITNAGFGGGADKMVQEAIGSTEGFTFVLAGAKAFLEQNAILNLVRDRHPDGLPKH